MRKTSQDGGDSTSITSGFENEYKKISTGIMRSTRNSLKKRVHSLSHEADDAVIEPLLQKDKEKDVIGIASQSAKYLLSKTKTEQRDKEKERLESNGKVSHTLIRTGSVDNGVQDLLKTTTATIANTDTSDRANHSNGSISSAIALTKSLVKEVKEDKHIGGSMGPLIFTTAKIHTDGKTKNLEPIGTSVGPISSIVETDKTPDIYNNNKEQDTCLSKGIDTHKKSMVKVVSSDIKLQDQAVQATATPDIVAGTSKEVSQQIQRLSMTSRNQPTTREKLAHLEVYLAQAENTDVRSAGIKKFPTETAKACTDTGQQTKEPSCKSKDSKDTTIKLEPFIDDKKIGGFESLADKQVSHYASTNTSVEKNPITKKDTHITNASKNVTETMPTLSAVNEKKVAKETPSSDSFHRDLNKIESNKQLQRQKTVEPKDTDSKVKPKLVSALPTPTSGATSKTLPNTEPKKEVEPEKNVSVNKAGSVIAKDIKDNKKTQQSNGASLIPTKTTKVMNVASIVKPSGVAKTSMASTIKQTPSVAASVPTGKSVTKVITGSLANAPNAVSIAKAAGKTTDQIKKDVSKDGKLPKA